MLKYHILGDDRLPKEVSSIEAMEFMDAGKHLLWEDAVGIIRVITIFLPIASGYSIGLGVAHHFETTASLGASGIFEERCCTYDGAETMHQRMLDRVRQHVASE